MMREIDSKELKELNHSGNVKIIDVRPVDAYNGWKLKNEMRGGHIKNAKSLPEKWLKYIDWIEIVRHKNILPDNNIVIYGYSEIEAEKVAQRFLKSGYKNVSVYNHFIDEWSSNPDLPMERLERYRHLVSAEWVNEINFRKETGRI